MFYTYRGATALFYSDITGDTVVVPQDRFLIKFGSQGTKNTFVKELRQWHRAITSQEVQANLYRQVSPVADTSLFAYLRMVQDDEEFFSMGVNGPDKANQANVTNILWEPDTELLICPMWSYPM